MKKFSKKFIQLLDFIQFTHEFREVIRVARTPHGKRFENDTEHSYQLAMVAWFLINQNKLKLNRELCFIYALSHDLVEIYAGDTYVFDKKHTLSQHRREKDALKKIEKRFSNFKNLIKIIKKYEKREDEESKFIYALDKFIPPIQGYLEDGKLWKEKKISLEDVIEIKKGKIELSPVIDKYWQELLKQITEEKERLF